MWNRPRHQRPPLWFSLTSRAVQARSVPSISDKLHVDETLTKSNLDAAKTSAMSTITTKSRPPSPLISENVLNIFRPPKIVPGKRIPWEAIASIDCWCGVSRSLATFSPNQDVPGTAVDGGVGMLKTSFSGARKKKEEERGRNMRPPGTRKGGLRDNRMQHESWGQTGSAMFEKARNHQKRKISSSKANPGEGLTRAL